MNDSSFLLLVLPSGPGVTPGGTISSLHGRAAGLRERDGGFRIHGRKEKTMSTAAPKKLLTAEEFFQLPNPADGSQQELVRGEIITFPLPGGTHGVTCSQVGRRIGNFVDDNHLGTVTS